MPGRPILIDVPTEIKSTRLLIRWPAPGDGPMINEAVVETAEDLKAWLPWAKETPTVEDSEAYAREARANFILRKDLGYIMTEGDSGRVLGGIGLHSIDWNVPSFEIGYWLRKAAWGEGYMTEAVRAIVDMAFNKLGARRIEIHADDRNERSCAVAERSGFVLEAKMKNKGTGCSGETRDIRIYSRVY